MNKLSWNWDTLVDAINTFGKERQMFVAIEEMSELTKAITKAARGMMDKDNLIEEIADVTIMTYQLMLMFDIDGEDVYKKTNEKIKRLEERINYIKGEVF